ncbi:MAG: ion transporter [Reyranella sp.]|nr:ion transporter [Reyranella sp.]MBL6652557.1 ion transporter [Reyranella sp.]
MVLHLFVFAPIETQNTPLRPVGAVFVAGLAAGLLILARSWVPIAGLISVVGLLAASLILHARGIYASLDVTLQATAWLIITLVIMWVVTRAVFEPGRITYHRILGAILLYLTIGVVFVALYSMIGAWVPKAFNGITVAVRVSIPSDLVYFSFTTLTTVGYGDIVPVHPLARSLSNLEAIIGQLYPATLLARLVSLGQEPTRA